MIQVSRTPVDNEAMKDFLRSNSKRKERQKTKEGTVKNQYASSLSSNDGLSSFMCDTDLLKELCPPEDVSIQSRHSKGSKCRSDIATSLDVNKFSDKQKTFCHGCRGYSISGITCTNKQLVSKSDSNESKLDDCKVLYISSPKDNKCTGPVNRICCECFADLTVLPKNSRCPNCCKNKSDNLEEQKKNNKKACGDASLSYFQKMMREILLDEKKVLKKESAKQKTKPSVKDKKKVKRSSTKKKRSSIFPR